MAIKFLTGYSGTGGSTICILEHCRLLDSVGFEAYFYGPQDWHLSRFKNSMRTIDFTLSDDDILIYHYVDANHRPNCFKFFLFLHETNLYDLRLKNTTFFDNILFSSESQKAWHGREKGVIVPNVMSNLVDKKKNNPPNKNIAGVVGHVHPIKNTHVSIEKALQDKVSKVHIYGPMYLPYFEEKIKPLLSDKVEYKGEFEPERRMEIYNDFDILYHFGEYESACLVLGECRILQKKVVKCQSLIDYPIYTDQQIVEIWKKVLN